jgi:hypothetical protein
MTLKQFEEALIKLEKFRKENNKVLSVLESQLTFGNEFIQDYIEVLAMAMKTDYDTLEWFINYNELGKRGAYIGDYQINNAKDFYNVTLFKATSI